MLWYTYRGQGTALRGQFPPSTTRALELAARLIPGSGLAASTVTYWDNSMAPPHNFFFNIKYVFNSKTIDSDTIFTERRVMCRD